MYTSRRSSDLKWCLHHSPPSLRREQSDLVPQRPCWDPQSSIGSRIFGQNCRAFLKRNGSLKAMRSSSSSSISSSGAGGGSSSSSSSSTKSGSGSSGRSSSSQQHRIPHRGPVPSHSGEELHAAGLAAQASEELLRGQASRSKALPTSPEIPHEGLMAHCCR